MVYAKEKLEDGYTLEYFHRTPSIQDDFCNYRSPDNIQTVSEKQIIPCKIDGDWEPTNNTSTRIDFKFHLRNSHQQMMNL